MKKIYAPWRTQYVEKIHTEKPTVSKDECVFCTNYNAHNDEKHYILKRGKTAGIIMNLYPYSPGHLMVLPFAHKADLLQLDEQEQKECLHFITQSVEVLKEVIKPDGFNIGINLGRAAGAGIPAHLHMHIVPRWNGDTNFMPIIAETKIISVDLNDMYKDLKKAFDKI